MNQSLMAMVTNLFTAPTAAFAALKERPNPWFPLLVLLVAYGSVTFNYLSSVDLPWFFDRAMQNVPAEVTAEQRARAVETQARISPTVLGSVGALSGSISFLAVFALVALYYTGVSLKTGIKYRQWFALAAWCSLPVVLGLLASLVNVLASDVRFMPQEAVNPLSFGNLLAIDSEGAPMSQRVLLSLDVTVIWTTVLQIIGYQAWTGRTTAAATAIVLGPIVAIVLIAALASL